MKRPINIKRKLLIDYAYDKAVNILINNKNLLIKISNDLLKYNTLNSSYFDNL